jgi:pimeloyl-ACP methyl ester carboxylesterase
VDKASDIALLHGGGQGSWVWDEAIAAIHADHGGIFEDVLALDVPGCGAKRERDTTEITPEAAADELIGEIRDAGMSDVLLVGHSQAGLLLPLMVERAPGLIRRLVHVSCAAPLPEQSIIHMMGSGRHGECADEVGWPGERKEDAQSDLFALMFCNDMSDDEKATFLSKMGKDRWPDLVTFGTGWNYQHLKTMPSTYVLCRQDGTLPVHWQEEFARRLHADEIVRIEAGHQPMNSRPREFAALLATEALK